MLWQFSTQELWMGFAFITCFCFLCGWVADKLLGYAGFGPLGNWLLLTAGAYAGMYGYNYFGYDLEVDLTMSILVVSAAAGIILLLMSFMKSLVVS